MAYDHVIVRLFSAAFTTIADFTIKEKFDQLKCFKCNYSSSVGIQKYSTFLFLLKNPESWESVIGDSSLKWGGPVSLPTRGAATLYIVLLKG